jgi:hypothetical protein
MKLSEVLIKLKFAKSDEELILLAPDLIRHLDGFYYEGILDEVFISLMKNELLKDGLSLEESNYGKVIAFYKKIKSVIGK